MPPAAPPRRRFLRGAGVSMTSALAGCVFGGRSGRPASVTPAPVPTDTASRTAAPIPSPSTPDDFLFEVFVLERFTSESPARLRITFRNTGGRRLTGVGPWRHVLPFTDDDYAGVDESGRFGLFLSPVDASLTIETEDTVGPLGEFLPDEPTDGCWTLPFDWPAARGTNGTILHTVSVPSDEAVTHEYDLYYLDACDTGRFIFESTIDLANTDPPFEETLHRVSLGFDLTIAQTGTLHVDVHEPRVGSRTSAD